MTAWYQGRCTVPSWPLDYNSRIEGEAANMTRWTEEEIRVLKEKYPVVCNPVLKHLFFPNRTLKSIQHKAHRLDLYKKNKKYWTDDEIEILEKHYPSMSNIKIKRTFFPYRTVRSIQHKATRLNIKKKRPKGKKTNRKNKSDKWTQKEIDILKKAYAGMPNNKIRKLLSDRTKKAISSKAQKLNLQKNIGWSKKEIKILKNNYKKYTASQIAEKFLPNKSRNDIYSKASQLGITKKEKRWIPKVDSDLLYLIGVKEGDGFFDAQSYAIGLEAADKSFVYKFHDKLEAINTGPTHVIKIKNDGKKDTYRVRVFGKEFYTWYKNMVSYEWLLEQKSEFLLSFLEGFYESEGHLWLNGNNPAISMGGKDNQLIYCVKQLLEKLGYNPTICETTDCLNDPFWIVQLYRRQEVMDLLFRINPCIERKKLEYLNIDKSKNGG